MTPRDRFIDHTERRIRNGVSFLLHMTAAMALGAVVFLCLRA